MVDAITRHDILGHLVGGVSSPRDRLNVRMGRAIRWLGSLAFILPSTSGDTLWLTPKQSILRLCFGILSGTLLFSLEAS
ncbi:hypothetical protein BV25DRAFT_1444563 [Artomyces pyxidatus]|uniref:Uncharacterized protein n=1 Tax=Artomyces pyxidatus TaxID=48021 RepID=A0ACB8SN69_9AGAM|nr:hypothetical protein BV25DRAFT_1444563 [Artomyces pyxidatus]